MRSLTFLVPGSIHARTGGSIYDERIAAALRAHGWRVDVLELRGSFPQIDRSDRDAAAEAVSRISDDALVLVDGLAFGALPEVVTRESGRLRFVALVHLPLADEIGLDEETASLLRGNERRALSSARHVIVTGKHTACALSPYGVTTTRISVVEPGTERAPLATGSRTSEVHLLCAAALTPGKGHDVLLRALASVPQRNWRLLCAGSATRHPETVARLHDLIRDEHLTDRVRLAGELDADAMEQAYRTADLFVLATRRETYGMAVAEALARGLPVVATATGAIADLVGTDAGVVVPVDDEQRLGDALSRLIGDPDVRHRYAEGARRVRERLGSWDEAAEEMSAVLEKVAVR